ncbi:MAG: S8 family serine peptidase [Acidipila sp.]|nr:S8 family serine peptidase [Acidipila sp.]
MRTNLGPLGLNAVCLLQGCTVVGSLDGELNRVFLVKPAAGLLPEILAGTLRLVTGILNVEVDHPLLIPRNSPNVTTIPPGLYDRTPVTYYGSTVWNGYANQPAAQIVGVSESRAFRVSGAGIVADIDTGVDPNHPALKGVLLPGYDFTRNQAGGSEMNDVSHYTGTSCSSCQSAFVTQSSVALLDQSSVALLDGSPLVAFGHGTEVMGVIHLVAPTARLMPLKAFRPDGTGNLSDIVRAIYYAVQNRANVINMSFDLTSSSSELSSALNYATGRNVLCVAAAGNAGRREIVYPAALQSNVVGVASTSDFDARSSFSNYGNQIVWVAAPGEEIITTYPFGTYAAASGTSFSAPFVSGTASLLLNLRPGINQSQLASALTHEKYVGPDMGYGRLDIYRTLAGR